MTEFGKVVQSKNDYVKVRVGRNSACASCGKCGMTENQKHVDFFVENTLNAQIGDTVEVQIPDANVAPLAFVAYILPLIPSLALMFVSIFLKWPEWASLLMFVAGATVGFGVVVVIEKIRKHKWMQSPTLKGIVSQKRVYDANADATKQPQTEEEQNQMENQKGE